MKPAVCDAKGRLYLPEDVRKKYGTRYFVVPADGKILLFPLADDPVADLREATKSLRGKSMEELKKAIGEQLEKDLAEKFP